MVGLELDSTLILPGPVANRSAHKLEDHQPSDVLCILDSSGTPALYSSVVPVARRLWFVLCPLMAASLHISGIIFAKVQSIESADIPALVSKTFN